MIYELAITTSLLMQKFTPKRKTILGGYLERSSIATPKHAQSHTSNKEACAEKAKKRNSNRKVQNSRAFSVNKK